mgnify:CR=1 FL=1
MTLGYSQISPTLVLRNMVAKKFVNLSLKHLIKINMKRKLQLLAATMLVLTVSVVKADTESGTGPYRECNAHPTNICYQVKNSKGEVIETKKGMPKPQS